MEDVHAHILFLLEILKYFCNIVQNDEDISVGVAAIRTLMEVIKHYKCRCNVLQNSNFMTELFYS